MSRFSKNITPFVVEEISKAKQAQNAGDSSLAFAHLEQAHVLGQESTYWHVKVHVLMLIWGYKQGDSREIFGQFGRIIGAALFTAVRGVPSGNTGGSNVSALKVMPISDEHAEIISEAKGKA